MIYVSSAQSREIHVFELKADGSSTLVQRVEVAGKVMPLAISPDGRRLYAALRSKPYSVSSFAIDPRRGTLTLIAVTPLPDDLAALSMDRSGRYLLGASYFGSLISVNAVLPNGAVASEPVQVIATGKNAHMVVADLSNRFLFVTSLGDDLIQQYRFDATTGEVEPNVPASVGTAKGAGPRHLALHPGNRLVFCVNELDGTVGSYQLDEAGRLKHLSSSSLLPRGFEGKPWAADLHLSPDGRFLYASERTSSTLAGFALGEDDGRLELLGSYQTEQQPRAFQIDPAGRFLLAVGEKSNAMTTYAIDPHTGSLQAVSRQHLGIGPSWIEVVSLSR